MREADPGRGLARGDRTGPFGRRRRRDVRLAQRRAGARAHRSEGAPPRRPRRTSAAHAAGPSARRGGGSPRSCALAAPPQLLGEACRDAARFGRGGMADRDLPSPHAPAPTSCLVDDAGGGPGRSDRGRRRVRRSGPRPAARRDRDGVRQAVLAGPLRRPRTVDRARRRRHASGAVRRGWSGPPRHRGDGGDRPPGRQGRRRGHGVRRRPARRDRHRREGGRWRRAGRRPRPRVDPGAARLADGRAAAGAPAADGAAALGGGRPVGVVEAVVALRGGRSGSPGAAGLRRGRRTIGT